MTRLTSAASPIEARSSMGPQLNPRPPRYWQTVLGVLALVAALPGKGSQAQSLTSLEPGVRIRVAAEAVAPKPLVGTLVRLDRDAMALRLADREELALVPRETITKVEVSRGRRSRGRGALFGALVGLAVGAIAVAATPGDDEMFTAAEATAMVGAMGAGLGALIGLAIPPGEKWESVPTAHISVVPSRRGHVRVALSVTF